MSPVLICRLIPIEGSVLVCARAQPSFYFVISFFINLSIFNMPKYLYPVNSMYFLTYRVSITSPSLHVILTLFNTNITLSVRNPF